jgi:probable FeS assembly SUF system protein SufT
MAAEAPIKLTRSVEAIQIPDGTKTLLNRGSDVRVTQSLGGTFTVMTDYGALMRIEGKDADALGKKPEDSAAIQKSSATAGPPPLEKQVWDLLKTCYDPEIPVNIVDLGLVYVCKVIPLDAGGNKAEVRLTLTAPGCGMGNVLKADVEQKVKALDGITEVDCEVVFEPEWDRSMMSEAAKLQLGMY